MKWGLDEAYIVDIFAEEDTSIGRVTGTCPCKGWRIRKDCSHLKDAREEHAKRETAVAAIRLGFEDLDKKLQDQGEQEEQNTEDN
jgi:hypothetical protein